MYRNNKKDGMISVMNNKIKIYIYTILISIISLGLDIITKHLVEKNIMRGERVDILGSFIQLTLTYNRGGIFGIMQGHQNFFLVISIIVLIFIILFFLFEKNRSIIFCTSLALIISGAIGNILDRISGKPGVVDFISIGDDRFFRWPAFNVADSVIVIGAFLLSICIYREEKKRKKQEATMINIHQ